MEKIKIYVWTIVDNDTGEIENIVGRSKLEVNKEAYRKYAECIEEAKQNECFVEATADGIVEFCKRKYNYICYSTVASTDFEYFEYEI